MVLEQPFETLRGLRGRIAQTNAEHDQAVESGLRLLGREIHPEGHPHRERALELEHPCDLVRNLERVVDRLEQTLRRRVGIGADEQRSEESSGPAR